MSDEAGSLRVKIFPMVRTLILLSKRGGLTGREQRGKRNATIRLSPVHSLLSPFLFNVIATGASSVKIFEKK